MKESDLVAEATTTQDDEEVETVKAVEDYSLSIKISASMHRQLVSKAKEESISAEELAHELLAEGLVVRAWEILERKSTMRGNQPSQNQHRSGNRGNRSGGGNHDQKGRRHQGGKGRSHNSVNLMEDKAAFMEYVRNQERKRR